MRIRNTKIDEYKCDDLYGADQRIVGKMVELYRACKIKDWDEFREYCKESDVKDIEMIFLVPKCTIDRCIKHAQNIVDGDDVNAEIAKERADEVTDAINDANANKEPQTDE